MTHEIHRTFSCERKEGNLLYAVKNERQINEQSCLREQIVLMSNRTGKRY